MNEFFTSFSNREIALLIWLSVCAIIMLFNKTLRRSLSGIFKAFFVMKIQVVVFLFLGYVALIVFTLYNLGFWELSLVKDTILWTFSFGIILVFGINKMNKVSDFRLIVWDAVKWTMIIEFLVAFYTFTLTTELILLPVLTIMVALQTYSELDDQHQQVSKLLKSGITAVGLAILAYVAYKTFFQRGELISIGNFRSLILPVLLTILFLPFIYFLTLYSKYENLFTRLNFFLQDKAIRKKVKKQILKVANVDLDKLVNISQNIVKERPLTLDNSYRKIKEISMQRQKKLD